jgi:hypothetical protein
MKLKELLENYFGTIKLAPMGSNKKKALEIFVNPTEEEFMSIGKDNRHVRALINNHKKRYYIFPTDFYHDDICSYLHGKNKEDYALDYAEFVYYKGYWLLYVEDYETKELKNNFSWIEKGNVKLEFFE